jgi:hypothetical protein
MGMCTALVRITPTIVHATLRENIFAGYEPKRYKLLYQTNRKQQLPRQVVRSVAHH